MTAQTEMSLGAAMLHPFHAPPPPAQQIGHEAAEHAANKAERITPGWNDAALVLFLIHARAHPGGFTTEEVRKANPQFTDAPDGRAWGAVALRAKRDGYVKAGGWTPVESSNGSPKTLWIPVQNEAEAGT